MAVSERALISSVNSLGSLTQDGSSPQRTRTAILSGRLEPGSKGGAATATRIGCVGAML